MTKCFVDESDPESPVTSWYWETSPGNGESSASGYIKFDREGNIVRDEEGFKPSGTFNIVPDPSSGSGGFEVSVNFEGLTMYSHDSSVDVYSSDGYPAGELMDFSIGSDGVIMGVYTNGKQQPLGMVALAEFDNASGLEKVGGNYYAQTANSGSFTTAYKPGTSGVGSLSVGMLEMSNVDLAMEFSNMIITQRGFQANSKIISTVDEMLQELINLKR